METISHSDQTALGFYAGLKFPVRFVDRETYAALTPTISMLVGTVVFVSDSYFGDPKAFGFVLADGASYNVKTFPQLFEAIGWEYSGDDHPKHQFRVPNLIEGYKWEGRPLIKAFRTDSIRVVFV